MNPTLSIVLLFGAAMNPVFAAAAPRSEWMGAYLNRTKVGYSLLVHEEIGAFPRAYLEPFNSIEERKDDASTGLYSEADLQIMAFGAKNHVSWRSVTLLEEDFSLSAFGFLLASSGAESRIEGFREGNSIVLKVGGSGNESVRKLLVPEGPVYVAEAIPLALAKEMREGTLPDGEYRVLEPHQLTLSTWQISYEGRETLETPQGPIECFRIKQDAGGFFPVVWIDEEGTVWKEFAPLGEAIGYYSYRETEAQARDTEYLNPLVLAEAEEEPDGQEPDLLYSTAIDAGTKIARPSLVRRMVVDLWNFEPAPDFPFSERQKHLGLESRTFYTNAVPLRLEIATVPEPIPSAPFPAGLALDREYAEFLEEETFIETKNPKIVELALRLTGEADSPWNKALAIYRWIRKNVETEFRITLPSALETLESKKGDCNEQSALFAALARAAGVPAKICTGLVYQGGAFYYHAWNEVLVQVDPEVWAPIDPAMRQELADATHIKFSEGGLANQTYINALIGKLKAQIREIDLHDPDRKLN